MADYQRLLDVLRITLQVLQVYFTYYIFYEYYLSSILFLLNETNIKIKMS